LNSGDIANLELSILEKAVKVSIYDGRTVKVTEQSTSMIFRFDQKSKKRDYVYQVTTFPLKIDPKGRVSIPVEIRKMLNIDIGDIVNQYLSISDRSMKLEKNGCGGVNSISACGQAFSERLERKEPRGFQKQKAVGAGESPARGPKKRKR